MSEISQVVRTTSKTKTKKPKRYHLTHYYNETIPDDKYENILAEMYDIAFHSTAAELSVLKKYQQLTYGDYSYEIVQTKIEALKFDGLDRNYILHADMTEIIDAN